MTNEAVPPLSTQIRSGGFLVDDTAPTSGQARLRVLYPRRYEKQPTFPSSITGLVIRVRVAGFSDDVRRC